MVWPNLNPAQLENSIQESRIIHGGPISMEAKKPTLEEVLEYAKKCISYNIGAHGKRLPQEHKDEIKQICNLKIIEKYPALRSTGWKAYVSQRCEGVVKDYKKQGTGFEDGKDWLRFDNLSSENDEISVDQVLSSNGIFDKKDPNKIEMKWDLLAKLASVDPNLKSFLKQIRSEKLKEISPNLGVSVSRADQMINEFIDRFDDPDQAENPWMIQTAFALGISELLGLPNKPILLDDGGGMMGDHLNPIDLNDESIHDNFKHKKDQQSFDMGDE